MDEIYARKAGADNDIDWYLTDYLGSVRQVVDTNGTVMDALNYNSFGVIFTETNPAAGDRFKFTAREWSALFGLQNNRRRDYDPNIARFTSEDPSGFSAGDTNLYRYVGNSPTNAADPSGLRIVVQNGIVSFVAGNGRQLNLGTVDANGMVTVDPRYREFGGPMVLLADLEMADAQFNIASAAYTGGLMVLSEARRLAERREANYQQSRGHLTYPRAHDDNVTGAQGVTKAQDTSNQLIRSVVITAAAGATLYCLDRVLTPSRVLPAQAAPAQAAVNALSQFQSRRYQIGSRVFQLDRSAMTHILQRHHPNYWTGTATATQSFLHGSMSPDDIADVIALVFSQNRHTVLANPATANYSMNGVVNGVTFRLTVNNGRIVQFYPIVP